MKKTNKKNLVKKRKGGFTLIELLAVIVILGVVLTIGVPTVMNIVNKAKKKAFILEVQSFYHAASNADLLNSDNGAYFLYSSLVGNDNYKGVATLSGSEIYVTLCSEEYCVIGVNKEVSEENIFEGLDLFKKDEEALAAAALEYVQNLFYKQAQQYYDDNQGDEGEYGNTTVANNNFIISYENLAKAGYIGYSGLFKGYVEIPSDGGTKIEHFYKRGDSSIDMPESTHREYSKAEFVSLIVSFATSTDEECNETEKTTNDYYYYIRINKDSETGKKIVRAVYKRLSRNNVSSAPWYYIVGFNVYYDQDNKPYLVPDSINENTDDYDSTASNLTFKAIEYNKVTEISDLSSEYKCRNMST